MLYKYGKCTSHLNLKVFHEETEVSCCRSKTARKCNFWETVREAQGKRFTMSEDSMNRPRKIHEFT